MAKEIKLNQVFLCERKIRFLFWKPPHSIIVDNNNDKDSIPLFLGADVLSDCNILVANLPRTHARFHKCGLSTKVFFPPSARVAGIHGSSRGVWFYSIQGLFRLAFEYYSREEQLDCLSTLSHMWKQRVADPILNEGITFTFVENMDSSSEIQPDNITEILKQTLCNKGLANSSETSKMGQMDVPVDDVSIKANHLKISEKVKNLVFELTDISYSTDNISLLDHLTVITKEYKSTLTNDSLKFGSIQEPIKENRALCVISRWMGTVFYELRGQLSDQASEFKRKHIGNIHNLPNADYVIDQLFPQVMKVFLLSWIDSGNHKCDMQEKDDNEPSSKLALLKSPFPLIQLILELANQTLVSGVAHVLYSRLVQAESVC